MWTFAVTRLADCIRLLACTGMNICNGVWSLCTVMQPPTVYSKHKDFLQSCYCKLTINPTYVADLAHWTLIFVPVTQRLRCHQLYSKRMQEPIFCHDSLRTLPTRDKHVRCCAVVSKSDDSGNIVLYFVFLWLSFRLWIWQRERNCLNSLP